MSFDSDISDYLTQQIGTEPYPDVLPIGASLPAIVYQRISTARIPTHSGTSLVGPLYQFSCWASTPKEAKDLAAQVVQAWEDRMGYAVIESETDVPAPGPKLYRRNVDVRLWDGLEADLPTS